MITHRQLFEYKNAQICTTIADPDLSDSIMAQIESTLLARPTARTRSNAPNYRP